MSRWIVDANNVMGARPDGWWKHRDRALHHLVDEIRRWRDESGAEVTVVIDGYPNAWVPEDERYGIDVRYAHSRARDAGDDLIVSLLARDPDAESVTVATSDRALQQRVRQLGASTEGGRGFLDRLADIETRRSDRAVLAHFGIDESALLGRGGEARVFALDDERVLRLPHPNYPEAELAQRQRLLDAFAGADIGVPVPRIIEERDIDGRTVIIEHRLPGTNALDQLARARDRRQLVRDHLDVTRRLADLPCPTDRFGELWGTAGIQADSFAAWARARVTTSLRAAGAAFASVDADVVTDDLIVALPDPEPPRPLLVHLDAFLGNMLADGDRISAVLDFGPMTIGGPRDLDPLIAIAYLAPEITPTATDEDRGVAREWAADLGLRAAVDPAERWIASYWSAALGDEGLHAWCKRILL